MAEREVSLSERDRAGDALVRRVCPRVLLRARSGKPAPEPGERLAAAWVMSPVVGVGLRDKHRRPETVASRDGLHNCARLREALRMQEVPPVDRAELETDRETLASLPDDAVCALPVGRIRGYLNALAVVLPSPDEHPARHEAEPPSEAVLRAFESTGMRLRPPDPAAFGAFGPSGSSRPWKFRSQAHLPSWGTIGLIVLGGALVLGTSAWRDDVVKAVGEAVVIALVGARAFSTVIDRDVRKGGGPDDVGEDVVNEPGALVGFLLLVVTYMAATVAVREGAALAGVKVSLIGAGLFGLLVTLSLALEYGVISADRLALK